MSFKFKILDLFVITTLVASLVAAFGSDLILFRQLLCLALIALTSVGALLLFPGAKRSVQFIGGIGGLLGGVIFLVIAFVFARSLYDAEPFFDPQAIPLWYFDLIPVVVISILFGATLGPLVLLRYQNRPIEVEFKKQFWFSIVLLIGICLLGLFSMFDRQNMQSRDWWVVGLAVSIVFVIHTNNWLRRYAAMNRREPE